MNDPEHAAQRKADLKVLAFALWIVTATCIAIVLDDYIGRALLSGSVIGTTSIHLYLREKVGRWQSMTIVGLLCIMQCLVLLALIMGRR